MKIHKIALFLVAVMSIFTLSCQHRIEEPRVIATVDDTIVVSKRVNQTIGGVSGREIEFTITLDGGTFNAVTKSVSTVLISGDDIGLKVVPFATIIAGSSSATFNIIGTPTKTFSGPIKMQIPASFISGRVNPVTVEAKNLYYNIVDNTSPYATLKDWTYTSSGFEFDKFPLTGSVQLENAYLQNVENGMDISTWIKGTSSVAPNLKFLLSIDETSAYPDRFSIIADGSIGEYDCFEFRAMSIPTKYLKINGDYNKDRLFIENYIIIGKVRIGNDWFLSFTNPVEIKGEYNVSDPKPINFEIEIQLSGLTFKGNEESRDVSSWFVHTVPGLSYVLSPVVQDSKVATITISGTPGDVSEALLELNELISVYSQTEFQTIFNTSSYVAFKSYDTKGSRYNITMPSDQFVYHIYDLASFGDTALSTTSPNRAFTKTYDTAGLDADIAFGDENLIYSGATKEASFPSLTRRGYKLAGFARPSDDGTINPDTASIAYKMGDGGNVTEDPITHKLTLSLDESDKGKVAKLYAVWERDDSSPYFKEAMKITITKDQVDTANPDDSSENDAVKKLNYAQLKDLKMHDGTTDLAADWKQEFSFIALPGGKIAGTDAEPEYYKWPVSWTPNSNPSTYGNIMDDFAISDIALTPALWNVVYVWATSDDRDDKKYNFTFDQSSTLLAGYSSSSSASRHSAEDPLVRINWYNAVIFANALTEWYNTVVALGDSDEKLTVAYTDDGTASGTPLRDASKTEILDKINSGENNENTADVAKSGLKRVSGATGFRLPTRTEWQYAASVLPGGVPSDWEKSVTTHTRSGLMYPYCQSYAYASGVDGGVADSNTKLKDYCVYSQLYSGKTSYGTQAVGKYFVADDVRTNGAKPNALGLYDVSGNTWEWAEEWYGNGGTTGYRFLSGGSWFSSASTLYVGSADNSTPGSRTYACGVRFCRTLSPKTTTK